MSTRLPQLRPKELIRAFERLGFVVRRQTGSHVILRHPETKNTISIPSHTSDLKRGLLFGILQQAQVSHDEILSALR